MLGWSRPLALSLVLVAAASSAEAHHSLTGYDYSKRLGLDAVVSEFHFINPHPYLVVDVGAGPAKQSWKLEMDNLFELREVGLDAGSFKAGDRVQISGSPSRDGGREMYLRRLDRPRDGLRYEQVGSSPVVSVQPRS